MTRIQGEDRGALGHAMSTLIWGGMCTKPSRSPPVPGLCRGCCGWPSGRRPAFPGDWQGFVCTGLCGAPRGWTCVWVSWASQGSLPIHQGPGPSQLLGPLQTVTVATPYFATPSQSLAQPVAAPRRRALQSPSQTPAASPSQSTAGPAAGPRAGPPGGRAAARVPLSPSPLPSRGLPYEVSAARRPRPPPRPPAAAGGGGPRSAPRPPRSRVHFIPPLIPRIPRIAGAAQPGREPGPPRRRPGSNSSSEGSVRRPAATYRRELLPPLLLVNCTFKWKIFGSQQKHCIQKRQSRSYNTTEEIVPGKLPFGRNELIARYIKLRTGKTRTRKQVSSHIQVLARKKVREIQAAIKVSSHIQVLARRKSRDFHSKLKDQTAKDKALQHMAAMSSAQIVSATAIHNKLGLPGIPRPTFPGAPGFWPGMIQTGQPGSSQDVKPFVQQAYPIQPSVTAPISGFEPTSAPAPSVPAWQGRSIGTTKLRLVEFSAFLEQQRDPESYNKHLFVHIGHANHSYSDPLLESVDIRQIYDKFPEKKGGLKELFGKGPQNAFFLVKFWADLNCNIQDDTGAFYGVTSQYESSENMTITCSTKVCSFGKQVVEKVETEYARFENGRFVYRINRSPMCEYMINFIHKLKHLPEKYMMNSVLENFTILLVVTNRDTQETLLCMACVFEVSNSEHGAQHHIYRLVKD
ncbi:transcriptional enhancer factor TEF-1 [Ciconia maguari]